MPDPGQICQIVNGTALPIGLGTASSVTYCQGGKMANASLWLGIAGLFLISVLMSRSFKGPIILGACAVPAPRPDAQAGVLACLGLRAQPCERWHTRDGCGAVMLAKAMQACAAHALRVVC